MKHKHPHTHRLGPRDPTTERYPHTHYWTDGPDDSHEHSHADGAGHVHVGRSPSLFEYWQRKLRWWCHKVWTRLGRKP